ncbi:uncharacterized protein LOC120187388 [Hibiscus syriacus]|uniref:uncharacterized protein LOC120187388 n=1 Tax=Hibiscus syriacus TaxID=106335 RepID=UPI001920C974|nr:uncharacterized protein LOC120187388 [Hibiscus syriacus]
MLGNWNILNNYDSVVNRRIWLLWKKGIDLSPCHSNDQSITVKCLTNTTTFFITAIYGSNSGSHRRSIWQHVRDLDSMYGSFPWILGGDFNTYLHYKESSDFNLLGLYSSYDMLDFQEVVQDLSLQDHPFFGPTFSWINKQKDNYLARKLDRVLINPPWTSLFQDSFVEFLAPGHSDHNMALQPIQGNPMQKLFLKLKRLKPSLKKLNKNNYSEISTRVRLKKIELETVKIYTLNGQNSIAEELKIQKELISLEESEYMFLKQKTKVRCIKERDKCTKLFHSTIASKFKRDIIRVLTNNEGKRLDSFDDMANEIIDYFKNQLGTSDPNVLPVDSALLKNLLHFSLPIETATELTKIVTAEEIKEALFSQGFFKGQRGIRQGDPLSLTLFLLAMNILSKIRNLVVAKGNLESIVGVTSILNHLYTLSGLNLNVSKTEFFTVGISARTLDSIKSATGFKQEFFPVRYLGVPLVTRKLTETDCIPLLNNIKARLHH